MFKFNHRSWDVDVISNLFNQKDKELILKIPLSLQLFDDSWSWIFSPNSLFAVKSCYRLIQGDLNTFDDAFWGNLWRISIPEKIKISFGYVL